MNINGLNKNLIDAQSVNQVSQNLFNALSRKSVDYSKADLSRFQRATLGVDLYSQKTDLATQREIAINNSGAFQAKMNLNSVQALNAFAAAQLYADNVTENVGGKMTIDANLDEVEIIAAADDAQNFMNVFETFKDKKDSNPFSFNAFKSQAKAEEA